MKSIVLTISVRSVRKQSTMSEGVEHKRMSNRSRMNRVSVSHTDKYNAKFIIFEYSRKKKELFLLELSTKIHIQDGNLNKNCLSLKVRYEFN